MEHRGCIFQHHLRQWKDQFFEEHHIDLLIHGHTHRPKTHQSDTGTRVVLGDWHKTGWCFFLDDLQQDLREFKL